MGKQSKGQNGAAWKGRARRLLLLACCRWCFLPPARFPPITCPSLDLFMSSRNASQLTVSLGSCEWKLPFGETFMTPFKGRHLKHRKEGTWKCHTVSRGLVQTAERQDGWELCSCTTYSMCWRNKTPVVREVESAGVPPSNALKMW